MKVRKPSLDMLFIAAGLLSCFVLYGCGASPLGPQEPLLPSLEGSAKFADRFQLEEEPQFFYDLFGRELLEGNEVYNYREEKLFDPNGELIVGWTGQLDSERFSAQLDRQILTEDTFRGRHTEFAIGDDIRLKPSTLFPNRYVIYKTEFDGIRWDLSFSQERHLFTLLNSRISNPTAISDAVPNLAGTLGRRNGPSDAGNRHVENARLIGFRAQGLLGDVFRVGFTYINLHKEHPERVENPLMGTVPNTPPETIRVFFRDDSPEDNLSIATFQALPEEAARKTKVYTALTEDHIRGGVGAAVRSIKVNIVTRALDPRPEDLTPEDREAGVQPRLGPEQTQIIDVELDNLQALEGGEVHDSQDGRWKIVEGFDVMEYQLDLSEHEIDPRQVKSVDFDMILAGDYNIVVVGFSSANEGDASSEWIKTIDGQINMPFRDVIQAPGNYGQTSTYTKDRARQFRRPDTWEDEGKPRKVRYRYGAGRAALLYGIDLEGTLFNTFIRAHYSINGKYKQYPTIPRGTVGFSRINPGTDENPIEGSNITIDPNTGIALDPNGIPTFSEVEGERFEARLGGDGSDTDGEGELGREVAWFINLKQRFGKIFLEETLYHIDPGYTTNYLNFGSNTDRDQTYALERTPEATSEVTPYDEGNYSLIEDDDDDDDWPDDIDFDGVLPQADDRDQNGILDFQEDFLIFEADPPIFEDLVDLNNNGVLDSLEDDFEPQFEYGIDREGYHITASYDLLDNLTLKFGWLNESEISSKRENNSKYLHLTYQRDIPDFGTLLFQNRFVRVKDDIPEYSITLRPGELEPARENDELDFFNARVNTTTLQFIYTAVPNLTVETRILVVLQKQFEPDEEDVILADIPEAEDEVAGIDQRVDLLVPIEQVREAGTRRIFPFYPDHGLSPVHPEDEEKVGLIYDDQNWRTRRYEEKSIRNQVTILKFKYEIPLGDVSVFRTLGEDFTLTPMAKYIWTKSFDRQGDEIAAALDPLKFTPVDPPPIEYLRFNRKSREDVLGVRLDYQFTQRMNILGGFQYRKFTNRDDSFKQFLVNFEGVEDIEIPILFRPSIRTRIFEVQTINRGEWLGFNIVILAGFRRTRIIFDRTTTNTTFVRAMMGF